jgi:gamma-glutamylcyclotransferase (GGCT)/AIG2-like uncharacterized protein YtfP
MRPIPPLSFTDADFPDLPYPGTRPDSSFMHEGGTGRPLRPDAVTPWRWRLAGHGEEGTDLADWLAERGAPSPAERIPVLAYGSNANPAKVTWLRRTFGLAGPVVVLRVRCTDLAAVWAAALRVRDDQRPATLMAEPGRVEWHAVWLATGDQVRVLDQCEGRGVRYRLVRLHSGVLATEDGTRLDDVLAYTAASEIRQPLLVSGRPVRCADVPQAQAAALVGRAGSDDLDVTPVDGDPVADDWPDRLFVYGTLRPGGPAWERIRPHVVGEPVPSTLGGTLYDTGRGYPALHQEGTGQVPGVTLRLREPARALAELDRYEGHEYRRVRVVESGGTLCWTYLWTGPVTGFAALAGGWR